MAAKQTMWGQVSIPQDEHQTAAYASGDWRDNSVLSFFELPSYGHQSVYIAGDGIIVQALHDLPSVKANWT